MRRKSSKKLAPSSSSSIFFIRQQSARTTLKSLQLEETPLPSLVIGAETALSDFWTSSKRSHRDATLQLVQRSSCPNLRPRLFLASRRRSSEVSRHLPEVYR